MTDRKPLVSEAEQTTNGLFHLCTFEGNKLDSLCVFTVTQTGDKARTTPVLMHITELERLHSMIDDFLNRIKINDPTLHNIENVLYTKR